MIYLEGRRQDVDALVFSPDGKSLAVGGTASHVQLWHLETRTVRKVLGPKGPHRAVAFLPGGRIMTATAAPEIRVGPLEGEGPLFEYHGPPDGGQKGYIHAAATADGGLIVACGQHNYAAMLECVALPDLAYRWRKTGREAVGFQPYRLCPCPDGRMVVASDHGTALFDSATGEKVLGLGGHLQFVPAVAVSRDGLLVAVAAGMDLSLSRLADGVRTASVHVAGRKQFTDVAFHPSGRWLLASSNDQTVRVYDGSLKEAATFDWEVGPVRRVAFSPDGMRAAAAGKTGRVALWDFDA